MKLIALLAEPVPAAARLRSACMLAVASAVLVSPASATITIYTDRVEWENAILGTQFGHFHDQDFEQVPTGSLSSGSNFFWPFHVQITGAVGLNAIDDSPMAPLSPNGSTYYRGDASVGLTFLFSELNYDYAVIGFGADWVVSGELALVVQETEIPVSSLLDGGQGFLGIISDQPEPGSPQFDDGMWATVLGTGQFGMDNIRTGNIPAPSVLAVLSVFGLVAARRRGRENQRARQDSNLRPPV